VSHGRDHDHERGAIAAGLHTFAEDLGASREERVWVERRRQDIGRYALTTNELFVRFIAWVSLILILYGAGMFVVVATDHPLGSKMLSGFASMFTGLVGLGSGYLLGRGVETPKPRD